MVTKSSISLIWFVYTGPVPARIGTISIAHFLAVSREVQHG